jgi:VanZ family protein
MSKVPSNNRLIYLLPFLGWLVLTAFLSLLPTAALPPDTIRASDKLLHVVAYGVMGYLLVWGYAGYKGAVVPAFSRLVCWLLTGSVGLLFEVLQGCMKMGRDFEFLDMVANAFGALLGTFTFYFYEKNLGYGAHS